MKKPPRNPRASLFGARQIAFGAFQGLVILASVLAFYLWALEEAGETRARAAAFLSLALANMMLALVGSAASGVSLFDPHRKVFWLVSTGAIAVLGGAIFLPPIADLFRFETPPLTILGMGIAVALAAGGWVGPARWLASRLRRALSRASLSGSVAIAT